MYRPLIYFALIAIVPSAPMAFAQPTPNIVLILSDDQGWTGLSTQMDPNNLGALSASDFYETPNLETLASQGMRFRQAYSAAPNCSPTRASILSGISPAALNMTDIVGRGDLFTGGVSGSLYAGNDLVAPFGAPRLPTDVVSIAQRIKASNPNYVTAHLGKWHMTTPSVKPSTPGGPFNYVPGDPSDYGYDVHDGARSNNPINSTNDPKEMFSLTSRAMEFIDDRTGGNGATSDDKPFYLQISHYATHASNETLPTTLAKYDAKVQTSPGVRHPDGANNTDFAGMTEDLDTTVGQLMSYLNSTPDPRNPGHMLADNTYVFYISDNGATEAEGNNLPLYDEKASTWEGGIRVPFIARGPGIAPNSVSNVPVISTDLHATITALAGSTAALPEMSESADLSGILMNGGALPQGVDSLERGVGTDGELFFHFPHYQHQKGTTPMSAMVEGDGSYKFVRIYGAAGQPTRDYLFDLTTPITNPFQTWETEVFNDPRNLANDPAHSAQLASMQQRFDNWIQEVDASLPYEVGESIEVAWDADDNSRARNLEGPEWRATTDVDHRPREQWLIDENAGEVELVSIAPSQIELGSSAYRIDVDAGFKRSFFHVSELVADSNRLTQPADEDNSVTFEFWLRADSLSSGQVLLETGGGDKGLSITLGEADNDGLHNDVRLRAANNTTNNAIETTASLEEVDIVNEFVHLVAVIDDDVLANTQVARIYLDGNLVSESSEVIGGGIVDWDGNGEAGLGMVQGVLGASGGPGLGSLGTTGFAGDIAQLAYFNRALSALEIQRRQVFDFLFLEGDLNADGVLDQQDVSVFKQNWLRDTSALSQANRYEVGDINEDGLVDLGDWVLLRQIFLDAGQLSPSLNTLAIPEPRTVQLLFVSMTSCIAFSLRQ